MTAQPKPRPGPTWRPPSVLRRDEEEARRWLMEEREASLLRLAHDVANATCVITSNLQYLELKLEGDLLDVVVAALASSRQLDGWFKTLQTNVRKGRPLMSVHPKPVPVSKMAAELQALLQGLVRGRDIHVELTMDADTPETIVCDKHVLDRVAFNLCHNAAKYTDAGLIAVEIRHVPGFLVVGVSDTGRGIPAERLERVLRPGGSDEAERAPNSSGMGLSIVTALLEQAGGHLSVASEPGVGSRFLAHIPAHPSPGARTGWDAEPPTTAAGTDTIRPAPLSTPPLPGDPPVTPTGVPNKTGGSPP